MATNSHDDREVEAARSNLIAAPEAHPPDDSSLATAATRQGRKRAYSIDVDEANQPRIQDLRLYTPSTATSNTTEGLRDLICLCTKAPKVPRPRNAFILYRQHYQGQVAARNPGLANPEISKLIGEQWREQPEEIKNNWKRLAEEEKIRHQRQYPDYRYQPRRGGKASGSRPIPATGEDPGHCPKCGGRYIATPRTPSTPFSAATPEGAGPGPNMPSYAIPNPRVIETDHLRRGSGSSIMSLDSQERRYMPPHMQNIDEDYPMMSPIGTPVDAKRRRFNGPNVFTPGSPPMGYMSADPRYHRQPLAGPPVSATGYGPGPLPRLGRQWQMTGQPNYPHMQPPPPPPRTSMSYQAAPTPTRHTSAFDESLRLPPLQTQVPGSPAISSGPGPGRVPPSVQSGHGHAIPNGANALPKQPQPQHALPRWPFLLKLEVLRSISAPLKPPGPGGPLFETRGPLIAIEGAVPAILKEVAAMLKWHKISEDLIRYITSHPPPTSTAHGETGENSMDVQVSPKTKPRLPVAVVSDGYSLTVSDRYASSLHVNDAYRADDHWQWLATLWRGIVGPDLTIYVKRTAEAEAQGNSLLEFVNPAVMVLHVAEGAKGVAVVDEKLERRLGFEIMEWVRSGSFKAGFVLPSPPPRS
ncbi:Repressor of filamentous growth 1 [Daldinia childiae]|uniref:Repressor of filamentous growth 1 n=1 Tax=Daldinia childiae TaxID=326645 RepID=UPI001444ED2E|nr:Repressor of filamentous growth 1 [Daldinia childiae]KAF3071137.1 Repressor of filamentous growth 1 [Daldinia childiae]